MVMSVCDSILLPYWRCTHITEDGFCDKPNLPCSYQKEDEG